LAKIPTELYICIPRRSSRGAFHTNIWANLTRKDTGQGIGGKKLLSFLDDVNISAQYTAKDTGYAGPFDINPKTAGSHTTQVVFEGDTEFEACKSDIITLRVDPNLLGTQIVMQASPLSGVIPLTIKVTGIAYEIAPDGSKRTPAYSLRLFLMVFDATSTRRLHAVDTTLSNTDGKYVIEYTFAKPGTYAVFINFLGDEKYISAWSNNGQTSVITVSGGGLPLSIEKSISVEVTVTLLFKWLLSSTEPTAPEGYTRAPDMDLDFGVLGKYWAFVKKT